MYIFPQGKFIRIHFGPTGKLASADIDICKLNIIIIVFFSSCFRSHMNTFLFFLSFRSSGKIQSDISAARWEELPHLLPDHVAEETRTVRFVSPAALDILLRTADRAVTWFFKKKTLFSSRHAAGVLQPVRLPLLLSGRDHCGEHGWRTGADGHWCKSFSFPHMERHSAAFERSALSRFFFGVFTACHGHPRLPARWEVWLL